MADRFDALVVRDYQDKQTGETKNRWTKIGVAFVSEKDGSIKVMLDANPTDGVIHLRKPRAQEDGGGQRSQAPRSQGQQQRRPPEDDFDGQF